MPTQASWSSSWKVREDTLLKGHRSRTRSVHGNSRSFTADLCASACTIAYTAGKSRLLVSYRPTLDTFRIEIPSSHLRNDNGFGDAECCGSRRPARLRQVVPVRPHHPFDHSNVRQSSQLARQPGG